MRRWRIFAGLRRWASDVIVVRKLRIEIAIMRNAISCCVDPAQAGVTAALRENA